MYNTWNHIWTLFVGLLNNFPGLITILTIWVQGISSCTTRHRSPSSSAGGGTWFLPLAMPVFLAARISPPCKRLHGCKENARQCLFAFMPGPSVSVLKLIFRSLLLPLPSLSLPLSAAVITWSLEPKLWKLHAAPVLSRSMLSSQNRFWLQKELGRW